MDIQQTPFVRELASSGYYHSDKPLTQQALARDLSYTLVPSLPKPMILPFLRAFWITISRDFHSLDRLRLDKYLLLIRCYIGVAFDLFAKNGQTDGQGNGKHNKNTMNSGDDEGKPSSKKKKRKRGDSEDADSNKRQQTQSELASYLDILEEGPLSPLNFDRLSSSTSSPPEKGEAASIPMPKGPDGVRYHLLDIWLEEIEKCCGETVEDSEAGRNSDQEPVTKSKLKEGTPIDLLLRPIERLKAESQNKTVRTRATAVLEDVRLIEWGVREPKLEVEKDSDNEEWGGIDD
ncbi:hypothetical protein FQN57_006872 [Myotisia sp. PD_48]|nr:hypothetical protein FQN57_006872 [Myotisia sp. PD_48]